MAVYYNSIERFMQNVSKEGPIAYEGMTPCWLWTARVDKDGYGVFHIKGKPIRAHRYAYQEWRGNLIPGHVIMHRCDVRNCVNPKHLLQGTQCQNNRDMFAKGRNCTMQGEKNPMNKLTEYQVLKIRAFHAAGLSKTELAKTFDITRRQVFNIVNRVHWKNISEELASDKETVIRLEHETDKHETST